MPNLGNAWHIPQNAQPRGRGGMRDPIGPIPAGAAVTILSGNQYQGFGNAGNQLQDGSLLFYRQSMAADWQPVPLLFDSAAGNDKFFAATIPDAFPVGATVQYYLRIAYDDHDLTFLHAAGAASATSDNEQTARDLPFAYDVVDPATFGRWGEVFDLLNVGIHASVLPDGTVLLWGRRMAGNPDLNVHECVPFTWDPRTGGPGVPTDSPKAADGLTTVNLFCSGHAFLPDGRLLVAGGHESDSGGIDQACLYDYATRTWTPTAPMNQGRWYPTAITLPDGRVLVLAGSYREGPAQQIRQNPIPQIWEDDAWTNLAPLPNQAQLPLYPRMHVIDDETLLMSGQLAQTWTLTTAGPGQWAVIEEREMKERDYCPAVSYGPGQVIYLGGGTDADTGQPTNVAEVIDLLAPDPAWTRTDPMAFPRRQHNATLLADGTVLVTGGTRGNGFNGLDAAQPVHAAEVWDPEFGSWTTLAAERIDRCYHAAAVLLPDATVLSTGGGEYFPIENVAEANPPEDTHADAQIFFPPYLFRGPRPTILAAPVAVDYGETFTVEADDPDAVAKVTWVRLSSVTHSLNAGQQINVLIPQVVGGQIRVTAPGSAGECPPGHYLMFLISDDGVPSEASIIQVRLPVPPPAPPGALLPMLELESTRADAAHRHAVAAAGAAEVDVAELTGTEVVVGITGLCPYGIGACWGGANEALRRLERVAHVMPVPDAEASTATVFLTDDGVPPLRRWHEQFVSVVNGSYRLRGVEVTLSGSIAVHDHGVFLELDGTAGPPQLRLGPIQPEDNVRLNSARTGPRPLEPDEAGAYQAFLIDLAESPDHRHATITGTLREGDSGLELAVRGFRIVS